MMFNNKRIFFVGAHPDDIEFGCGALISSIREKGNIYCLTLSSMKKHPKSRDIVNEHKQALSYLGIPEQNIFISDFEERIFLKFRQDICDYLYHMNETYKPNIVFSHPPLSDMHQDHEVVSKEVLRVFKKNTIIGFEVPPSFYYQYSANFYYYISEKDVDNKLTALSFFNTYQNKDYFVKDKIKAQLVRNGIFIGKEYAEAFAIIRFIEGGD